MAKALMVGIQAKAVDFKYLSQKIGINNSI